ncbi:unnamed protein product [Bemisia tabaci]|uniref:Uncharacterized protein n=1 Tax=Bemisia tabaci TaxID=7038 RepID=A0A9P0ALN8_BEMTA|nr:unnamed protein product [Bemisia tabaci]
MSSSSLLWFKDAILGKTIRYERHYNFDKAKEIGKGNGPGPGSVLVSPRRPRRWCGGGGTAGGGGGRSRPPRGAPRSAEAARRPKGKRRSRGTYELWRILDDAWTQMRNDPGETRAEQKLSAKHKKRSRIAEASRSTDHDNVQEPGTTEGLVSFR